MAGGCALLAHGYRKGSWISAIAGGDLIFRGASGWSPLYKLLGINTALREEHVSVPYELGIRVDKAITIGCSRPEVYRFWRKFENLPLFMRHLKSVARVDDKHSHWAVEGPGGRTYSWEAEINNEIPNELIGWRSLKGSDVDAAGSVRFQDAPGGRGTEVYVELQYNPPLGTIGGVVAKLMGADPAWHIEEDLHRLKQYLEAGEIATTEGQPSGREAYKAPGRRSHRAIPAFDRVEEASMESFPASDAPGWRSPELTRR